MPAVGFGTYPHQGEDSAQTVEYAISIGYRLFDTALSYGNERGVGEGIRRSGVPRDEVIVTSKLPGRYHGLAKARASVSESVKNLGVNRIDLYLIHCRCRGWAVSWIPGKRSSRCRQRACWDPLVSPTSRLSI